MKRSRFNSTTILSLAIAICTIFAGCSEQQIPEEENISSSEITSVGDEIPDQTVSAATESTTLPTTEPVPNTQGSLSLEDCKGRNGVFIAYDDGSFDRYIAGGYCEGLKSDSEYFDGMYWKDEIADQVVAATSDTTLVVFSEEAYSLRLYPIHGEVAVFTTTLDDGTRGYGRLTNVGWSGADVIIDYDNHEYDSMSPLYINGKPAEEYQAEHIKFSVRCYSGISKAYDFHLWGFTNEEFVTFGVADGTTLIEETYPVNATYYDCNYEHNNHQETDYYFVNGDPTPYGYATVDLTDVPNGKYVMVYRYAGKYQATLLILNR